MPDPVFLSGDAVPDYLKSVELMSAGMEWHASTGDVTITLEHLADAVLAASDPHIQPPRIKLGHCSPVNGDGVDHDPFAALGDAVPSFGQFTNLRLVNDGAVLVGDATNVPAWLAEIAPAAYPNRSAEVVWQVDSPSHDVQTDGGRRYSMVITAVSLLGIYAPAISDLEDLTTLIMAGPSALQAKQPATAAASTDGASLSVSYDTVRDRFNWSWAYEREDNDFEADTTWWWARDVRFDPDEVIADDDQGNLWSVPFTTDGEDKVTFGEPARVRQTYVPVAASKVATFARPSKPQRPPAAAASANAASARPEPEEGEPMGDDVREILVGQGLDPDTATEEQVNAASVLAAAATINPPAATTTTDPPEGGEPSGEGETEPAADAEPAGDAEPAPDRVPVAASRQVPEGAVVIDADELARLRAGAADGARLAAEQRTKERDALLAAARDEGRFPPSRLAHYTRLYDTDPEGTRTLLTADEKDGGLAKGTVPLAARAEAPDPEGAGDDGLTAADRALLAASRDRMGFQTKEVA